MACKTILVHLADPKRAKRLLDAAVPLAREARGHLIGIVIQPPYVIIPASDSIATSVTIDEHRVAYKSDMAATKAMFTDVCRGQAFDSEWREVDANFATAAGTLMDHARSSDLVVVGERDTEWSYSTYLEEPERVAIECGRPVLVVPNTGRIAMPPRRALVAWNGRREAARAAFDAVALLPKAANVTVLWVDTSADRAYGGDAMGADLCTTLARHGFKCEAARVSSPDDDAGATILQEAAARGADLIVMGAYGHSRVREFLLGGASRDVLAKMDRPLLMSH